MACASSTTAKRPKSMASTETQPQRFGAILAGTSWLDGAVPMVDSSALMEAMLDEGITDNHSARSLRERFERDGYLLLRGLIPAEPITDAREFLFEQLRTNGVAVNDIGELESKPNGNGNTDDDDNDDDDDDDDDDDGTFSLLSRQDIAHDERVLRVLEHQRIVRFLCRFYEQPSVRSIDFKWLRAVKQGAFTGVHTDRVYVGDGSQNMVTLWFVRGVRSRVWQPVRATDTAHEMMQDSAHGYQPRTRHDSLVSEFTQGITIQAIAGGLRQHDGRHGTRASRIVIDSNRSNELTPLHCLRMALLVDGCVLMSPPPSCLRWCRAIKASRSR